MKIKSKKFFQKELEESIRKLVIFHIRHPYASSDELAGELKTILRRVDSQYDKYRVMLYQSNSPLDYKKRNWSRISRIYFKTYGYCENSCLKILNDSIEVCKFSELYDELILDSLIRDIYEYNFSRRQKVTKNSRRP